MRNKQSLNGYWSYRIGEGGYVKKKVPFSALPVGLSECKLDFDSEYKNERAFLVFEGITYEATAVLNGKELGKMLAYCEYRFEITDILKEEGNTLSVFLSDMYPAFGPSEGWENYGGIIRDVYVEYTSRAYIKETLWNASLSEDMTEAECTFDITSDGKLTSARAILTDKGGNIVASADSTDGKFAFTVHSPALWSPDTPTLYTLTCSLFDGEEVIDTLSQKVGFKSFEKKGKRFLLNGEPIFILGVNRHDLWGDGEGHTLTEEQMQKDMRMIKETGVNYVRLVHYPHNKRILEIADEIGLLVSEEPGLWWSDTSNKEISEGALEVMRRTVIRDRNHVSVAFWLAFNECFFTLDYLKESVRVCRENDPFRMVSGANCMSLEETKENFLSCGFDFYTMHPYAPTTDRIIESASTLTEMPLIFTEWGGYYVHNNPQLFGIFIKQITDLWNNPDSEPVVAGATYWCWAEMNEFGRRAPACTGGMLREGLVDAYRNILPDHKIFRETFAALLAPRKEPTYPFNVIAPDVREGTFSPINIEGALSSEEKEKAWGDMLDEARKPIPRYHHNSKKNRPIKHGPVIPYDTARAGELPLALVKKPYAIFGEIEISINRRASALYIVGNTSIPKGYPIDGKYGEDVCEYTITYEDGSECTEVMKNGADVTTAESRFGPSRIDPVAASSGRLFEFRYDDAWEHYIVNLHRLHADEAKVISSFKIRNSGNGYIPLLYGITLGGIE